MLENGRLGIEDRGGARGEPCSRNSISPRPWAARSTGTQLTAAGTVIAKHWLHISCDEQLSRFEARKENPYKRYKLTDEEWRNREKWSACYEAVDEMLLRTSTTHGPWTVIPANSRPLARVMIIETLAAAMKAGFKQARRARREASARE